MAQNVFDEIVDWLVENSEQPLDINFDEKLYKGLLELGILSEGDILIDNDIEKDWYQSQSNIYTSIISLNVKTVDRTRTLRIFANTLVYPPTGISLERRADILWERYSKLKSAGVNLPQWYLIWRATIYGYYPPISLFDFISNHELLDDEYLDIAESIYEMVIGLVKSELRPPLTLSDLRIENLRIYYCGIGEPNVAPSNMKSAIDYYEDILFRALPPTLYERYKIIKDKRYNDQA